MDLRSLRYFVSAAEQGSITAAADQCHVAQPSISNAIAQLESEFGLRLFSRGKKGVALTPDGQIFLSEANRLLTSARQMEARFKATSKTPLHLGIHSQLASHDSGYLLQVVAKTLGDYRLDVQVSPAQAPDLWLTSARLCPTEYRFIPLLDQEYRLLAPTAWPIAKPVRMEDVLVYPWIDRLDCELRDHFLDLVPMLAERTQLKVDTEDLAVSLVRHRQGVTAMAVSDDIEDQWPDLQCLPLGDVMPEPFRIRRLGVALHPKTDPDVARLLGR
ncbi:LysR family transcriptional regulator [Saccharospirillum salsuginis]|uniref:LysR family transcriptional regulator n=1 Tax=Saccharospirillum salsuginis TaxID=418750 RepID=A0A918K532_9GAMM|nr:LysR family transcriptional regulator [Saccharospirillum salsuginis]GGX47137.1 LysR family transcriptional regulator [Saccharospirillum salsuginis]